MKVTYIYHSGFLVETESAVFLFDYYKGKLPPLPAEKPLIIFASHKHPDHFSFKIFNLQNHPGGVTYVFGNDIKLNDNYLQRHGVDPAVREKIHRMPSHTELTLPLKGGTGDKAESVTIHTLKSTDAGAAFYVKEGNVRIYHGGDLNWWHWEGESKAFNRQQECVYKEEIGYLQKLLEGNAELDAAFVPLDPRLMDAYCLGMDYFLSHIPVKEVFPMHMWDDYDVIQRYRNHCKEREDTEQFVKCIKNPLE